MLSKDKAREYAAILQAFAEGKEIQYRWRSYGESEFRGWTSWDGQILIDDEASNGYKREYRIAPEPRKAREWWIVLPSDDETRHLTSTAWLDKPHSMYKSIKVRE